MFYNCDFPTNKYSYVQEVDRDPQKEMDELREERLKRKAFFSKFSTQELYTDEFSGPTLDDITSLALAAGPETILRCYRSRSDDPINDAIEELGDKLKYHPPLERLPLALNVIKDWALIPIWTRTTWTPLSARYGVWSRYSERFGKMEVESRFLRKTLEAHSDKDYLSKIMDYFYDSSSMKTARLFKFSSLDLGVSASVLIIKFRDGFNCEIEVSEYHKKFNTQRPESLEHPRLRHCTNSMRMRQQQRRDGDLEGGVGANAERRLPTTHRRAVYSFLENALENQGEDGAEFREVYGTQTTTWIPQKVHGGIAQLGEQQTEVALRSRVRSAWQIDKRPEGSAEDSRNSEDGLCAVRSNAKNLKAYSPQKPFKV
ncbi:hypothetical protein BT96DRAFT_949185 [Gymnopus androsaceus JB14]|uniref:Uncharacterized protein n=1 Tax=Gymnopus androsaceus JB14 TaxID=1447944 RepID=A0A6A4GM52_9AGAR|nr:hypothetical protein BT96DRAFT_949185 [Gymnopus androsaceus JB14]